MSFVTKTVKLPEHLANMLSNAAKQLGCSESQLIREGIEYVTSQESGLDMKTLIGADVGVGHGPNDLSYNRKHLKHYGRSRHR